MANSLLTISMITREAIDLFVNTNQFIKNINRQYDSEFGKVGNKVGNQLRIRLPNDYVVTRGAAAVVQDTAEQQTTLTMAIQDHVDVSFTEADLLLSLDDFSERILHPMMNNLAGKVAAEIMAGGEGGICNISANLDANTGAILNPNSLTYLMAQARLNDNSAPMLNRRYVNDPFSEAKVVNSLSGLLNPNSAISDQYYSGSMYDALGGRWFMDQTVIKHTAGSFSAGTVNGAGQTGTALVTNAITGTLKKGDIITLAGVNAVNRVTKQNTGRLRQFVVTSNAATLATGLNIYPAIVPAGPAGEDVQYQTVDVSPANAAVISLFTLPNITFVKNFLFAPQMVTMATGDLPLPPNTVASRAKYDEVSMRSVRQYSIGTDQEITRVDVLYGYTYVRPEWGCITADNVTVG